MTPDDEREDDEREHRERHARAEEAAQRVRHRQPQRSGASGADAAEHAASSRRAGAARCSMIVHVGADDDIRPPTRNTSKSIEKSADDAPTRPTAAARRRRSRARPPVYASRSGSAERRAATGARLMSTSETPSMNGVACARRDARTAISSSAERRARRPRQERARVRRGARRLGQVADRGRDVHPAHAPGGERDDQRA